MSKDMTIPDWTYDIGGIDRQGQFNGGECGLDNNEALDIVKKENIELIEL